MGYSAQMSTREGLEDAPSLLMKLREKQFAGKVPLIVRTKLLKAIREFAVRSMLFGLSAQRLEIE